MKSRSKGQTIAIKVVVVCKSIEGVSQRMKDKVREVVKKITGEEPNVKSVPYSTLDAELQFKKPFLVICMPDVYLLAEGIQERWNEPVGILALQDEKSLEEKLREKIKGEIKI